MLPGLLPWRRRYELSVAPHAHHRRERAAAKGSEHAREAAGGAGGSAWRDEGMRRPVHADVWTADGRVAGHGAAPAPDRAGRTKRAVGTARPSGRDGGGRGAGVPHRTRGRRAAGNRGGGFAWRKPVLPRRGEVPHDGRPDTADSGQGAVSEARRVTAQSTVKRVSLDFETPFGSVIVARRM